MMKRWRVSRTITVQVPWKRTLLIGGYRTRIKTVDRIAGAAQLAGSMKVVVTDGVAVSAVSKRACRGGTLRKSRLSAFVTREQRAYHQHQQN